MSPKSKEVYTLRWNDWLPHLQDQLRSLKKQTLFADLTVVTEEGTQFHTHKVVLANSSLILNDVLKESEFAETLILHEISARDFESILDFVYDGQVNIAQDDLPRFFSAAQSLGVKGLVNNNTQQQQQQEEQEEGSSNSILVKALLSKRSRRSSQDDDDNDDIKKLQDDDDHRLQDEDEDEDEDAPSDEEEEDIPGEDEEDDFKQSASSAAAAPTSSSLMLSSSSSRIRATDPRPCPKCGKIYRSAHTLRTHLEDKHTICPGYRCVLCGTVAKSRNSLHSHMSRQHRGISTKDLPVLPMPAPFDPELARRLLTGQPNPHHQHQQQQQQQFFGSSSPGGGGGRPVAGVPPSPNNHSHSHHHHHKSNGGGGGAGSDSSSTEASTGSAILDTYLQFIAENTLFK